ncbi:MAG: response regulator [Clostridia bacterium]|nr:response regulator [Clostridia bacterium]
MISVTIDDNQAILDLMKYIMNKIDPEGSHFFACSAHEGLMMIESKRADVVFLDIEMPEMSGEEAAYILRRHYGNIDIICITGHSEYAMLGHKIHCSSFITKPFDEHDIFEALKWVRVPVKIDENVIKVRCSEHFAVFANGEPFNFSKRLTIEIFAYLIYKQGAFATNGELVGVFWDGDPDKQDLLRKHIKDMRDCFDEVGAGNVLVKKRGSIGVNFNEIELEGDPSELSEQFGWLI